MQLISGISKIAHSYDTVLLDQFGVIHNGQTPYPAAITAIERLHQAGKRIVILSNSSKESHHSRRKLQNMGVPVNCIDSFVTSGELAMKVVRDYMQTRPQQRVLHFNWGSTRGTIGLSKHAIAHIAKVKRLRDGWDVREVDMVLAHGTDGISVEDGVTKPMPLEEQLSLLRTLASEKPHVTLFCANPDIVTVDGDVLRTMPGTLAREYEKAGGNVVRLGKPGKIAYEAASAKGRILAIGDSVGHDVFGADGAGVDCLFICGGIHREKFFDVEFTWNEETFKEVLAEEEVVLRNMPKYACDFFVW